MKPGGVYIDATLGGGGHSFEIARRLTTGRLIGIDQDADAIEAAKIRLAPFGEKITVVQDNFRNILPVLGKLGLKAADGILMDLGVSSHQLDTAGRGFSYNADAPLDMRMDKEATLSAFEVVNTYSEAALTRILRDYGEERFASRIARLIVKRRENQPIATTFELVDVIKGGIPAPSRREGGHPAKRSFQAIRIEVNRELAVLEEGLDAALKALAPGGRLAVITFHSLEDRIVKSTFAEWAKGCICPKDFPVCVCNRKPMVKLVTKKPVVPDQTEEEENNRARSAKLRAIEKTQETLGEGN